MPPPKAGEIPTFLRRDERNSRPREADMAIVCMQDIKALCHSLIGSIFFFVAHKIMVDLTVDGFAF